MEVDIIVFKHRRYYYHSLTTLGRNSPFVTYGVIMLKHAVLFLFHSWRICLGMTRCNLSQQEWLDYFACLTSGTLLIMLR
jgi:hypothetical protein